MKRVISIVMVMLLMLTQLNAKDLLVVDTSMSVKSKAQEVKNIVHKYLKGSDKNVLAFSSDPYFIKSEDELVFRGSTALSLALKKIQPLGIDYLIIVTDGSPDNPEEAIVMANKLKDSGVTICGVYVSDTLEVPEAFEKITDKTFAVNQFNQAIAHCTDIRQDLIGTEAIHKSVDADKYVF